MRAFGSSDHAPGFKDIDLGPDRPPVHRSLGLRWNRSANAFGFQINCADKPFTKRGVLSVVNSLYDPLGFVAPITIQGKSLLRQLSETVKDWDAPLPPDKESKWETWKQSLCALDEIHIQRCYAGISLAASTRTELHVFSDASTEAIAAVVYLKVTESDNQDHVGFVFGKAKLAPKPDNTIPRLELCGTVLAVELADFIQHELDIHIDDVQYYSDSKVVLGYIYNQTRCFYVYVSNRIERIRRSSKPEQWHYIPSELNPANYATRPMSLNSFANSSWLSGPKFLLEQKGSECFQEVFSIQDPNNDPEVRSEVSALATNTKPTSTLGCQCLERFSNWMNLVKTITRNQSAICLKCQEEPSSLSEDSHLAENKAFSDTAINKEISELKVHCEIPGCNWSGDHQSVCDFAEIHCHTSCGKSVQRKFLAEHLNHECPSSTCVCLRCSQRIQKKQDQKHNCEKTFSKDPGSRKLDIQAKGKKFTKLQSTALSERIKKWLSLENWPPSVHSASICLIVGNLLPGVLSESCISEIYMETPV
ncbi:unnamed protein product [Ranitomeya imitator]|uniref:TRAF-type domain-containing protein n=1 Tax=Ranitomeya imitator TaxID=111125 RepID=A0ABN9KX96_9NEOB|nr:unnamed protein product [Ranitomeya imitator]